MFSTEKWNLKKKNVSTNNSSTLCNKNHCKNWRCQFISSSVPGWGWGIRPLTSEQILWLPRRVIHLRGKFQRFWKIIPNSTTSHTHIYQKCTFSTSWMIYIYIFWRGAGFGLHCCTRAFSSCGEWGLLFVAVHGLLTVVASLAVEHGL